MLELLKDLDHPESVIRAIEDNAAEFLLAMGRAGGGAENCDPQICWTIGGSPIDYHNAVVRTHLTDIPPEHAIEAVVMQFRAHHVPGSWHVGPSTQPANLGTYLVEYGFHDVGGEPGMAVDLSKLQEDIAYPKQMSIERVRTDSQLDSWAQTLAQGFGEGAREANWVRDIYRTIGLSDGLPWRHYLAWLDGEPVATASLFLAAGAAGIYFVMTVPKARRQGIGAAITLKALQDARQLGYRVGVLGSSKPGYAVYQRLGFQEFCQIGIYEWNLRS